MKLTFHILDALSRDQVMTVTRETDEEQEVEVEFDDADSNAGDYGVHSKNKQLRGMIVHLFGMTADGQSVRLDVTGFRPYFYVEVPASLDTGQFQDQLKMAQSEQMKIPESLNIQRVTRKKLYGFTATDSFSFFKLSVASLKDFRTLKNFFLDSFQRPKFQLSKKSAPLAIYESGLDPLLRFFHLRDIAPCGWVSTNDAEMDEEASGEAIVYTCDWEDVNPEPKPPKPAAPFKSLFWDLECYSASGDFPVAKPSEANPDGDPIIQIGNVLKDSDGEIKRVIFTLGSCDAISTAEVRAFNKFKDQKKNEQAMLLAWFNWLAETNPDVWVGYNIFGFDEHYVWDRAEHLRITNDPAFQSLSRLTGAGSKVEYKEKTLSSSALGDNVLRTITLHGRLQVDLFHVVKRGYQLPSYKLDDVTKYFMSGKLKKVTREVIPDGADVKTTWVIQTGSIGNAKVGRAVVLLDETGDELTDKLQITEIVPGGFRVLPSDDDIEVDTDLAVKWVIVKDDVSPADIMRLQRGSAKDRALIAAYCIQDCELTMELYNKLETFNNAMCMANVCSVPITMIFTRGQGVKIESLIFKYCNTAGQVILTLTSPPFNYKPPEGEEEERDKYEGAIVLDPVPGFYTKSPIGVCDFASLYPSTIESENISYDSLLWTKDYDLDGKEIVSDPPPAVYEPYRKKGDALGYRWIDISFDIWKSDPNDTRKQPDKIIVGKRVCRYAQPPAGGKSTLPIIVRNLLAARAAKRAEIKKESDPFRKALLDAEQLAYKLTANSLYGQLGSATFKIRLQHLAASVTAYGRKQILFAKAAIEKFYGPEAGDPRCSAKVVYGDTDSLFVDFGVRNPETGELLSGREAVQATIDITTEAGHFVTKALKKPHDFEFDKAFYPFIIFSKKRYVGNMYEENADDFVQKSMGIAAKRRDYAGIVKTVYGGAVKILLNERDAGKAAEFVKRWIYDLVDNKVSLNQLLLTRQLKGNYKTATPPAHKILADRIAKRDPGNAPASGDRLAFVYFKPPPGFKGETGTQGDRVETPTFMKTNGLKPDPEFYIDHQLESPLSQLFSILVDQLPNVRPPPRGWSADPEIQVKEKELYARDYLFKEARMKNKGGTLTALWGLKTPTTPVAQNITSRMKTRQSIAAQAEAVRTQSRIDSLIMDRMLVEKAKQQKRKTSK